VGSGSIPHLRFSLTNEYLKIFSPIHWFCGKIGLGGDSILLVKIKVTGLLTEYFPAGKGELPLALKQPKAVKEILQLIKMNHELVMTVMVNGERKDLSYVPGHGDEIVLVSPLAGG